MQLFDFDFRQNSDLPINILIYNLDISTETQENLGSNTDNTIKQIFFNIF